MHDIVLCAILKYDTMVTGMALRLLLIMSKQLKYMQRQYTIN